MSNKLLNDVASILAELGVSYQQAENVADALGHYFTSETGYDDFVDLASNAPSAGECGC
jgi:hypothetical protein